MYLFYYNYNCQNITEVTVMRIDYKLIGARIQKHRKEKRLTQETLAERICVSVGEPGNAR